MTTAEASGRTVDDAVEKALAQLGVARSEVEIEILQEPKMALLGFGGREARVRLTVRPGAADALGSLTTEIVHLMGLTTTVKVGEAAEGLTADLESPNLSRLVGRDGRALDALELVAGLHLHRRLGRKVPVVLDAMGYRAHRERAVREAALQAAERAAREGAPVELEPMSARDRRSAHLTLKDDARVTTSSLGEDDARRVVVLPRTGEESPPTPDPGSEPAPGE
ncbi:MAG: RNA-binding cell elongation regulator Jag/EloR [bacterium]|nr:RNA-binding cell elongation regulator Jag/EloR [bacterium]